MAVLGEIVSVLLGTEAWPAVYVGDLPKGVREVMRVTVESLAVTFEDGVDRALLSGICAEMGYSVTERDSRVEEVYDQHGNLLERRTVEWEFSPRVMRGDVIVAHVSPDFSQVYVLPLLDRGAVDLIEAYRRRRYG